VALTCLSVTDRIVTDRTLEHFRCNLRRCTLSTPSTKAVRAYPFQGLPSFDDDPYQARYLGGRHNFRGILQRAWTENIKYAGLWPGFMAVEICYHVRKLNYKSYDIFFGHMGRLGSKRTYITVHTCYHPGNHFQSIFKTTRPAIVPCSMPSYTLMRLERISDTLHL
jgi:hypothetical protein